MQAIGNLVIDSGHLRQIICGHNYAGLKAILELINCKRAELSEQCFWTINNFLLSERSLASPLIQFGICKSIKKTFEDIKNKSIELLTEMFWTLNYLLDFDESSV